MEPGTTLDQRTGQGHSVSVLLVYGPILTGAVWCLTRGEVFVGLCLLAIGLGPWAYIFIHVREEARTRERIRERRRRRTEAEPDRVGA